jgi:hypothetical protein
MSDLRRFFTLAVGCLAVLAATEAALAQAVGTGVASGPVSRPAPKTNRSRTRNAVETRSPNAPRTRARPAAASRTQEEVLGRRMNQHPEGLAPIPMEGEAVIDEALPPDEASFDGLMANPYDGDGCSCGGAGCALCQGSGIWSVLAAAHERMEVYHGVTAFTGPINRGGTGSFGFEGGINLASPLFGGWNGIGVQTGVGGTLTNFNGADFTRDDRGQLFITAGVFRRVDWGLQWGLVYDYLHDDWYGTANLSQIRGEVSWVVPEGSELGFLFAASEDHDTVTGTLQTGTAIPTTFTETWTVNDYYALFLRHSFCGGGQARIFAGWTGTSDGILGADAFIPLNENWSLRNSFTYIIPQQGPLDGGNVQESWNLSMQLVWYPCAHPCGVDYYRPLLNVANNGTFFVNR